MTELYTGKYAPELLEVTKLVKAAGVLALKYHGTELEVTYKAGEEPVTVADKECSALLVEGLEELYPDDTVVSEEAPDNPERLTAHRVWYVDPIDGTKNFVNGDNTYCVMVGLAVDHKPVLGVVYQPNTGRLVYASEGEGAYQSHGEELTKLRSSDHLLPRARLLTSSVAANTEMVMEALGVLETFSGGSIGMKLTALACGASDLYVNPESHCSNWDTCAPEIILSEAGGKVTDFHGNALRYDTAARSGANGLVASNGNLHEEVVEKLTDFAI
jgi:3'(2'), 5'-bisphosphate nucleotidase